MAGVMVIGEINHTTAHVMNILWMLGTFTFAITLGLVTEDLIQGVLVCPNTFFGGSWCAPPPPPRRSLL